MKNSLIIVISIGILPVWFSCNSNTLSIKDKATVLREIYNKTIKFELPLDYTKIRQEEINYVGKSSDTLLFSELAQIAGVIRDTSHFFVFITDNGSIGYVGNQRVSEFNPRLVIFNKNGNRLYEYSLIKDFSPDCSYQDSVSLVIDKKFSMQLYCRWKSGTCESDEDNDPIKVTELKQYGVIKENGNILMQKPNITTYIHSPKNASS
ncbi:MAG: hypothetical protein EOP00_25420 [Pedobacter sp.]|nr:MAG: hypothetical protein EOP00_25420 [Pedobacter sp.]